MQVVREAKVYDFAIIFLVLSWLHYFSFYLVSHSIILVSAKNCDGLVFKIKFFDVHILFREVILCYKNQ